MFAGSVVLLIEVVVVVVGSVALMLEAPRFVVVVPLWVFVGIEALMLGMVVVESYSVALWMGTVVLMLHLALLRCVVAV